MHGSLGPDMLLIVRFPEITAAYITQLHYMKMHVIWYCPRPSAAYIPRRVYPKCTVYVWLYNALQQYWSLSVFPTLSYLNSYPIYQAGHAFQKGNPHGIQREDQQSVHSARLTPRAVSLRHHNSFIGLSIKSKEKGGDSVN